MKFKDKHPGLANAANFAARAADKLLLNGAVFNYKDQNGAPKDQLELFKFGKDLVIWIPFVIMALKLSGVLSPEVAQALNEVAPK